MKALNRVFVGAMTAAVLYFLGELFGMLFLNGQQSLQTVLVAFLSIIYLPAFPVLALAPAISRTVALGIACLGWGGLLQLYHLARERLRARRLTSA